MEDNTAFILSKYTLQPGTNFFPFDFRSNPNVYCADSQLPDIYQKSTQQFDKNLCFYNLKLTPTLKENIFPKQQYKIPTGVVNPKLPKHIEKIKLDDLFGNVKVTSIDVFSDNFNLDNIEESLLRQRIKEIINNGKVVPYEKKQIPDSLLKKREWYLLGMRTFGPYQDKDIYEFLKRYYNGEHPPGMKFMIWEAINDIFYTPETCYDEISKLCEMAASKEEATKKEGVLSQGTVLNDFEAMKNNLKLNEQQYPVANPNFQMRIPFRRFTNDLSRMNMGPSYSGQFGLPPNTTRSFNRKRSYQIQYNTNIPSQVKVPENKVVKEIVFDPFGEDDEPKQKEENVKTIDINSLFT